MRVADEHGLETDKLVGGGIVLLDKSVIEFVADRAKEARHRGILSVSSTSVWIVESVGILVLAIFEYLILAGALLMTVEARAASMVPNDCWSGVMAADKATHGRLIATGPVTQWRVGTPVVVYSTIEDYTQIQALADQGKTGTFDIAHPITVIPTWISGPESGDKNNPDEQKNIEVTLTYHTTEGETGTIMLTYWTPMGGKYTSLPREQQEFIIEQDRVMHDSSCRGIP